MEIPAPAAVVAEVAAEPAAAAAGVAAAAGLAAVEAAAEPGVQRPKGLEYIEGVGSAYSQKLSEAGITTVEALLDKGATPQGRKELADTTGISEKLILRWVNMADLFRIKGVGQEYAELLEAAGVDTVPELAQRAPANLLAKMETANEQKKLVRRLPVLSQVESWVEQAKSLPRVITH
jgi:predicted flap endonuclease-1-like 5' DNA nuclease